MAVKLDRVVPFGRSLDEYVKMFSLSEADLQKSILSVADGPASFNAEGTAKGHRIQSIDPLYAFGAEDIRDRFYAVLDNIIAQVSATPADWVWNYHASPAALRTNRIKVTETFCADYPAGKQQGRYTQGSLPQLPYPTGTYDMGLCSHFLFLYSDQYDIDFHLAALGEMLRVSREVRVFPLLTLGSEKSPHLLPAIAHLQQAGYRCAVQPVSYELQRGGCEMLQITR